MDFPGTAIPFPCPRQSEPTLFSCHFAPEFKMVSLEPLKLYCDCYPITILYSGEHSMRLGRRA